MSMKINVEIYDKETKETIKIMDFRNHRSFLSYWNFKVSDEDKEKYDYRIVSEEED